MKDRCINPNNSHIVELAEKLGKNKYEVAIDVKMWQDINGNKIPTVEDLQFYYKGGTINYSLKSINILQSDKAKQIFEKGKKANWDLNKILTELQVPKEQKQLILDLGITDREQIALDLASNYSYSVEINTAKTNSQYSERSTWNAEDGYQPEEIYDEPTERNTSYYSNLTVPGGTNYTENAIQTPNIINTSIAHINDFAKGIANMLGWFRSDESLNNKPIWWLIEPLGDFYKRIDNPENADYYNEAIKYQFNTEQKAKEANKKYNNKWDITYQDITRDGSKTRRILEVQSDLFQKGRDEKYLTDKFQGEKYTSGKLREDSFTTNNKSYRQLGNKNGYFLSGDTNYYEISENEYQKAWKQALYEHDNRPENPENQFLQLLNKDNNWVTFFVKSIIQDSAKKGYEKILFPLGETIAKIEQYGEAAKIYAKLLAKKQRGEKLTVQEENAAKEYEELNQKAVIDFYENTVANILKKQGYNPTVITDEYGNTWNEIVLNDANSRILLDKSPITSLPEFVTENYAKQWINDNQHKKPNAKFTVVKDVRLNGFQNNSYRVIMNNTMNELFNGPTSTSREILTKIANSKSNLAKLALKLLENPIDFPIEIVNSTILDNKSLTDVEFNGKAVGLYYKHKIYLAKNGAFKHSTEATIIHEILHAYTNDFIHTQKRTIEYKNLERLYNHILNLEKEYQFSDRYPLKNLDEFIVAIFTNPTFINDLKNLPATSSGFKNIWDELLKWFKDLFKVGSITLYDEVFSAGAVILENESQRNSSQLEYDDMLADESNFSEQQSIVTNLLELQGKQIQGETTYKIEGFETELKRPSALAKKDIQNRQDFKTEAQKENENIYTSAGTLLHAMQGDIIKKNFPEANTHLEPMIVSAEYQSLYNIVENDEQLKKLISEAKSEGTVLMAEVFVGNLKLERGGTIDLLGVTKEGNYKLYDLKNRIKIESYAKYRYNKLSEFTKQVNEYKKILEEGDEKLGIRKGKVLTTQIIENVMNVNTKTGKIMTVNGITFVAPFFLRTENNKLNSFINRLEEQIKGLLAKEPKDLNQKEEWNKLLNSKIELMQSLQLKQDANEIIEHSIIELAAIQEYVKDEANLDTKDMESQLLLFANISDYLEYDDLTPKQQTQLSKIEFEAKNLRKKLLERGVEVIKASAITVGNEKFEDELFSAMPDSTFLHKMIMGVSNVSNPLINTGYKLTAMALARGRKKLDEMKDKLEPLVKKFKEHVGSLDYSMMLTDDKNSLVGQYSSEFWKEFKTHKAKFDAKWAKENLIYDKEAYEKAYKLRLDFEDSIKEKEFSKIRAWLNLREDKPTDTDEFEKYVYNVYWKNRTERFDGWFTTNEKNSYLYFKAKDKWLDPKWKAIKQGKYKGTPVEEFYDFYTHYMEVVNEFAPEKVKKTFIANFSENFLTRAMDLGLVGAVKASWSELFNQFDLKYDETLYGKVDPYTGEVLNQMIIPGLSKNKQTKSVDLATSLYMFMEGAYRYQELSQIEATINHVKTQIKNLEEVRLDSLGNPIEENTKIGTRINPSKQISQQFDYFVDAIFYNKTKKDEGSFLVTGTGFTQLMGVLKKGDTKQIAYAKLVDSVIKWTGLKNLSGNIFAPMVNLLGASANQYMTGFGGFYYSLKNLSEAQALLAGSKTGLESEKAQKLRMVIDWLELDKKKIHMDIFKHISKSKINNIIDKWNGMTLFRESELLLVESGAGAMVLSGKYEIKLDDFEIVDGKIKPKENVSDLNREMFRQKVMKVNGKNIGSMNPDDVVMAKKWFVGRMLMQHRGWLPQLAYNRFGKKKMDYILGHDVEGRYRVAARTAKYIMTKGFTKGMEALTPYEISLAKEAFAEAILIAGVGAILMALRGADDETKKEAWFKYSSTISNRLFGELVFFADITLSSQFQILLSPAASTSTFEDIGAIVKHTWKEVASDLYEDPEKARKEAKPLRKAAKLIPNLGQGVRFIEMMNEPTKE